MPNRVIKESIKRSPQIDALTWFEEVVFYRLIVTADDYGCIDGRPVLIKNELFPTRENVTRKSVEDAITKLVAVGLLYQYEVDGKPYLAFPTWEKHQRIRNKHRKYPAPPNDIHLSANCCQTPASCQPESESESESELESESKSESESARQSADVQTDSVAYRDVQALYNQVCPRAGLPKSVGMSEARRKAIRARFAAGYKLEDFAELFKRASESTFLTGQNERNWMANFDWLITDRNMPKVLSGNYDDRGKSTKGEKSNNIFADMLRNGEFS